MKVRDTTRPEHSPLGASGAERWLHCPGSVTLLKSVNLPESDAPDYRKEGTAMHAAAEHCLTKRLDAWEIVGQEFGGEGIVLNEPMAMAVQVYIDLCVPMMEEASQYHIEARLTSYKHSLMYGQVDFAAVYPTKLAVVDLKGGRGIIVEPDNNPQCMYYAYLIIEKHPEWSDDMPVELWICQPRGEHREGPSRMWSTTVGAIRSWVTDVLLVAMVNVELDGSLDAGPWCRFCPAKLVCPMLTGLFEASAKINPRDLATVSDKGLGLSYQKAEAVKFYIKAQEEEVFRRVLAGRAVPGVKLVDKRANRVWKTEAAAELLSKYGEKAWKPRELLSPPQMEDFPGGKTFVRQFAYTPHTGYTIALANDRRPSVKAEPVSLKAALDKYMADS